jgi:hypothetical protein
MTSHIKRNYVAREFVSSENSFDDINPVNGSLFAKIADGFERRFDDFAVA